MWKKGGGTAKSLTAKKKIAVGNQMGRGHNVTVVKPNCNWCKSGR